MLSLTDISLRYGKNVVFDEMNTLIGAQDKIGLVGSNGSGKSTLLGIILGEREFDAGKIEKPEHVVIGYLPQDITVVSGKTLYQEVASAFEDVHSLQEKIDALLVEGGGAPDGREEAVRLGLAYQKAVECLETDRRAEALEKIDALLAQAPDFLPARILRGEALLAGGDEPGAMAAWRSSFLESGRPVFLQRIEDHFIERENPLRAIETLHELIAEAQNDLLPRFFLGRLYYRLEMHDEAFKTLKGLEDRVRSSPIHINGA